MAEEGDEGDLGETVTIATVVEGEVVLVPPNIVIGLRPAQMPSQFNGWNLRPTPELPTLSGLLRLLAVQLQRLREENFNIPTPRGGGPVRGFFPESVPSPVGAAPSGSSSPNLSLSLTLGVTGGLGTMGGDAGRGVAAPTLSQTISGFTLNESAPRGGYLAFTLDDPNAPTATPAPPDSVVGNLSPNIGDLPDADAAPSNPSDSDPGQPY